MRGEILFGFVDWENLRRDFRLYQEYIGVKEICSAFQQLGQELGTLRGIHFYGDWTKRPQEARIIEELGYRAKNVLSKRFGQDRSDISLSFDMYDMAQSTAEITAFILGAGDADYKEVIIRSRERGKRIYVLCFGKSTARELISLTHGVYPLEARLGLHEKIPAQPPLPGILPEERTRWNKLIQRLDRLEKGLAYVVRNYLRDRILSPSSEYGETPSEIDASFDSAVQEGVLEEYEVPNPKLPGRSVICVRLNRTHPGVQEALGDNKGEAGSTPASP